MKNSLAVILLFLSGAVHLSFQYDDGRTCHKRFPPNGVITLKKNDINERCYSKISEQIHKLLTASITYLAMGAHFSKEEIFRPAVANYFLESANKERENTKKMMEYMLHRGGEISETARQLNSIQIANDTTKWSDVENAFESALEMEQGVTKNIVDIIGTCKNEYEIRDGYGKVIGKTTNDYHAVKHFTRHFLTEQYDDIRKLAGFIANLQTMKSHGILAEVLFDLQFDKAK